MRRLRPSLLGALVGLLFAAGCEAQGPLRGTYVMVERQGRGLQTSTSAPPILYLNPCRGGCFIQPGPDDARTDRSSIVSWPSRLPEFPWSDDVWVSTVRCVQRLYAPFEIIVTDQDPGDVIHTENIVAGRPGLIGQPGFVGGIAPLACGGLSNAISFSFAAAIGDDIEALCHTIGQETAHAFGLDHELLCSDPMTYMPACGEKAFQRIDAPCGEEDPRPCICGEPFQNSHLALLQLFGPRRVPLRWPPEVRIASPEDDAMVTPSFRAFVEASDDVGLDRVDLYVDGEYLGTSTVAPHVFLTPADLTLGPHELLARAYDVEGIEAEDRLRIILEPAKPRPDASVHDRGAPRPDAGAIRLDEREGERPDAGGVETIASPSCDCRSGRTSGSGSGLGLMGLILFAGARLWRRR